ncbi:MAG: hypothetical protein A3J35_07810 [Gammaproteobacteria bacterium RIFCSPLOWO2_02_FULL_52_10]|nr:MAG: hypothetical protein A3J35_07810 [Gammaproteobacteria bacterium RIFCSPLOWO2_02_FULL_52_10]
MPDSNSTELSQRIDAIESGYEFLLAYAAQGRRTDKGAGANQNVREFLQKMDTALGGLGEVCSAAARNKDGEKITQYQAFLDALAEDASKAQGVIRLVLACPDISSQLVDNMNTNVHLRALLTDLFVIDDALK